MAAVACIAGLLSACGGGGTSSNEPSATGSAPLVAAQSGAASQPQTVATESTASNSVPNNPAPNDATQQGGGREANYFRLTKDKRTCAAPACGGVYATTMNTNVQITCPNGELSATCYVGKLDTAALGYSPFDASNGEPVKVKGSLTLANAAADGSNYGNLAVEKVFLPVGTSASHLMHHLYVITNNGLVCDASPCLKYNSKLANRSRDHTVSSFDFSKLGLTVDQVKAFRYAVNSGQEVLIQVGEGQNIETETGVDVREGINGLFMPVQAQPTP